ncbi:xanthine dehydrogenase family protein molybdopterin-binding subunit [Amycolatopsis sp. lyj-108]|uniref:xanthine dehydrogenase family protein molybdopterin-binding subunit n=1 Tax=Amycolatopsis sp. lyj-108 TaxID=2789286 RepID=UPI00397BCE3D
MTSLSRVEGRLKVTGAARYSADYPVDGLVNGYLLLSTVGRGTIRAFDATAALRSPGVLAVYSHANPLPLFGGAESGIGYNWLPLRDDQVRHHGQIIGLVVAETFEQARDAAALVRVDYAAVPARTSLRDGMPGATQPDDVNGEPAQLDLLADGVASIDEALGASPVVVTATYTQPIEYHSAMEPHAAIAVWRDGYLTLYSGAQAPQLFAGTIAATIGVDPSRVHLLSPHVGGGFGNKILTWGHPVLAAAAAKALGRPVRIVLTREQTFGVTGHRSAMSQTVSLGADRGGRLAAVKHDAYASLSSGGDGFLYEAAPHTTSRYFYASPNIHVGQRLVTLDVPPQTPMRAPGPEAGSFALETAMDELAVRLGLDPVELRMRNYATTYPGRGVPWSGKHLDECYRVGAEAFGWSRRAAVPRSVVDGEWLVGTGMATAAYPASRYRTTGKVRLQADGTAAVSTATSDLGTGMWTVLAMVGADALGIPVGRVRSALGDSALADNPGAFASAGTASSAPAVHAAALAATRALLELAVTHERSPFHGLSRDQVRYERGDVVGPRRRIAFGTLLGVVNLAGIDATETTALGPERERFAFTSFGAHFCEIAVNRWTGEPRLRRVTTVIDAGAIVNEKTARGQITGGVIFGIGQALLENTHVEPDTGRIANANLADYALPVSTDVPPIDVRFLSHPDTVFNPLGVRGIGELGTVGIAAAIGNAVHHATGRRVRDLPITLDKLMET